MAVLTADDRKLLRAEYSHEVSVMRSGLNVTKNDLQAAIDAIDDWVEANMASFNQAIPQPARAALTARQKAALLMKVANRRFELAPTT
jgi:hypothetical protein